MNPKTHITQTTLSLFAEQGYGNTSIAMIARKAGVAQGLMYNFYPSKEALLTAILMEGMADVQESMVAYIQTRDPKAALRHHIQSTVSTVVARQEFWRLFHAIRTQKIVQDILGEPFRAASASIVKTLAINLRKLQYPNPTQEARLLFAQIDGMVGLYLLDPKGFDLHKMQQQLLKKYT